MCSRSTEKKSSTKYCSAQHSSLCYPFVSLLIIHQTENTLSLQSQTHRITPRHFTAEITRTQARSQKPNPKIYTKKSKMPEAAQTFDFQSAEELLQRLPRVASSDLPERECCICREEYGTGDEFAVSLPCHHIVGNQCIFEWLSPTKQANNTCPYCRRELFPPRHGQIFEFMDLGDEPELNNWFGEEWESLESHDFAFNDLFRSFLEDHWPASRPPRGPQQPPYRIVDILPHTSHRPEYWGFQPLHPQSALQYHGNGDDAILIVSRLPAYVYTIVHPDGDHRN